MLKIYNTLTRKKQTLGKKPGQTITLYVCGITPYDKVHLGHARCYVFFDVLNRYLRYSGYTVKYIQNYTDIDDKIIERARSSGRSIGELADENIGDYESKIKRLNIIPADAYPRATSEISNIIQLVQKLIDAKHAYISQGDVYFDVQSFTGYGKLSRRDVDQLKQGARVEVSAAKKNPLDFALWKKAKEGEPSWESPWGTGRPGWHIECSSMSMSRLGETIDIHGGGQDLIFPHHENEIAQSEAATGKPFVRIWMHNGFVTVNQEKMSKSLGNFFTLEDIFKKYDPMVVRLFLVSQHYRSPIDFSDTKLDEIRRTYENLSQRIKRMYQVLQLKPSAPLSGSDQKKITHLQRMVVKSFDDDLNTGKALGHIFTMIHEAGQMLDTNK
ncbi:MAG: cysteine--tRNA ligase, partial [Elusimicrobia bacterium]|nr:cysteine--tRNA ligase [Elusimicrobiota bacterium]MBD3411485.1 cysteine--tRNA ligase [Elusimicrobiota bacterium]